MRFSPPIDDRSMLRLHPFRGSAGVTFCYEAADEVCIGVDFTNLFSKLENIRRGDQSIGCGLIELCGHADWKPCVPFNF